MALVTVTHASGKTKDVPEHTVGYWAERGWHRDDAYYFVAAAGMDEEQYAASFGRPRDDGEGADPPLADWERALLSQPPHSGSPESAPQVEEPLDTNDLDPEEE